MLTATQIRIQLQVKTRTQKGEYFSKVNFSHTVLPFILHSLQPDLRHSQITPRLADTPSEGPFVPFVPSSLTKLGDKSVYAKAYGTNLMSHVSHFGQREVDPPTPVPPFPF